MSYETIIYQKQNGVATLTLNRPAVLNAISPKLALETVDALKSAQTDSEVRVIIITGGPKVFCVGADLKAAEADPAGATKVTQSFLQGFEQYDKPMIAAINGYAVGGGCEIAMGCDLRIASTTAKMGLPEIKVGLIPGGGGTQRLTQIVGPAKAKELMLLGDFADAAQAQALGLVTKVVPPESLMDEAMKMALVLAKRAPLALRAIKKCVQAAQQLDFESERRYTREIMESEDAKEGMRAFIEKREPVFKGK